MRFRQEQRTLPGQAGSLFTCFLLSWFLEACAAAAGINAAPLSTNQAAPFLRFREASLEYHGPEVDLADSPGLKEVKIGWFGPWESTNQLGVSAWRAACLAIQEANRQGGCHGLPFRLIPRWAVDPWGTGISQLTRMVYDEHPIAVIGSIDSPSTHLAEQIAAKAQLPLLSPFTTDPSVTLAGVSWMFSCAPSDRAIARVLVGHILEFLPGKDRPLVLLSATDHESRMRTREVLKEFSRRQSPPGFHFEATPGSSALPQQMEAMAKTSPGVVLIVAGPEDSARWVNAVRTHAPAAIIFGMQSMGLSRFRQLAGPAAEGVRFPWLFVPDNTNPATARFLQSYGGDISNPPDYMAALAYDGTRLLIEAVRHAGLKRVQVREAIKQLSPWHGIAGVIQWDGTGQNSRTNIGMGQVQDGRIAEWSK